MKSVDTVNIISTPPVIISHHYRLIINKNKKVISKAGKLI